MPNEVFNDLNQADFSNHSHKCFAYAYYYLISYLYRNALYGGINTEEYSTENIVKLFLGNPKPVSYITKKNGILDKLGYTETTTDYPISYYKDKDTEMIDFITIKKFRKDNPDTQMNHSPRLSIKTPLKALNRFNEDYSGTYYTFQNTHKVNIKKFVDIITDINLGHVAFYIYCYLRMMNDKFPQGYQISNKAFADLIGCSERTIARYTTELESKNYIKSERKLYGYKLLEKIYKVI
jgi:Helix-turn-helix domain